MQRSTAIRKKSQNNSILNLLYYPNLMRRIQAPVIMRMLDLKNENIILDVGCGGGFFAFEISKICHCIGIDWKINNNLFYLIYKIPSFSFLKADVQKIPLDNDAIDKILLSSVIQMVENDEMLLKECYRVLKKEGVIVLSVPVGYRYIKRLNRSKNQLSTMFKSKGKGFYSYEEIVSLLKKERFQIIEIEYSPKRVGSFIYETWLYLCFRLKLPLFHTFYFFLLYPIAYFDRFDRNMKKGNEVIIKAKKV